MTISMENWCETCNEACHDHPSVCTVCGSSLGPPPAAPSSSSNTNNDNGVAMVAEAILGDTRQATRDLNEALGLLRGEVRNLDTMIQQLVQQHQHGWTDGIPPELLNPQAAQVTSRPTSKDALAQIPRVIINDRSTIFRQAKLTVQTISSSPSKNNSDIVSMTEKHFDFSALLGEFGPLGEHHLENASLVKANPLTGKGGCLSKETVNQISLCRCQTIRQRVHGQRQDDVETKDAENDKTNHNPVILFMQRGDGVTFVQKAIMGQNAGASAIVIGNNMSDPWPYVMKDSKGEAEKLGLTIPVVIIKEAHAKEVLTLSKQHQTTMMCKLHITGQSHDCVVCCEALKKSETVLQLPCAHIFHEACAMAWLKSHNTCPYCRKELPTDDEKYEQERRRQQRTHAGSGQNLNAGGNEWNEYYR